MIKRKITQSGILILMVLIGGTQSGVAQTLKKFFDSADMSTVYLGIDFTHARVLNDTVFLADDIRDRHYPAINQVPLKEPKKYDFKTAFSKLEVRSDIEKVTARNAAIDQAKIMEASANELRLNKSMIESIVKEYKIGGKEGVGILFIMESMNKTSARASMYVTLIDMASGKMLFTERMVASASGFGFRNYWVRPVYLVLDQIKKEKYAEWKKDNG